jgi:hypothetical protein
MEGREMSNNKTDPCAELRTRIPALPGIMRRHGWGIAPYLMELWLHKGANSVPEHGFHNTDLIRMDWVLSFERANEVYNTAKANKVWMTEKAQDEIIRKIIRGKGRLPAAVGERIEIGNVGEGEMLYPGNWLQFHKDWQIQYADHRENKFSSPLDDLYGALGDFSFYYLVKGWVERIEDRGGQPRYKVTLNKIGVYLRDSYDFNDKGLNKIVSQPLGVFGCSPPYIGNGIKVQGSSKRYFVTNKDFCEWRQKYGKGRGGDFLIFSDIKRFDTSDNFEFSK